MHDINYLPGRTTGKLHKICTSTRSKHLKGFMLDERENKEKGREEWMTAVERSLCRDKGDSEVVKRGHRSRRCPVCISMGHKSMLSLNTNGSFSSVCG